MGENRPGGRVDRIPREFRGAHPASTNKEGRGTVGLLDGSGTIQTLVKTEPNVRDFLEGQELPTDVRIYQGAKYYDDLSDIIPESASERGSALKTKTKPIDIETRPLVVLRVSPLAEGEQADANFKVVGKRGLYVRVIRGEKEEIENGVIKKVPIKKWTHWNKHGTPRNKYIYS